MTSPQLENGYTRIANEIMQQLSLLKLSGQEWQILMTLIRKTYGFHKKEDIISLSQWCESTGLSKQRVCENIRGLEEKNIITRKRKADSTSYYLQKNFRIWKALRKNVTLRKNVKPVTRKRNLPLRENGHTKENSTKEMFKYIMCCTVISALNISTGKNFNIKTLGNHKNINARIKEGYKLKDFFTVIDYKNKEWKNNDKMRKYLRPSTLFNSEKFDGYLQDAISNKVQKKSSPKDIRELLIESANRAIEEEEKEKEKIRKLLQGG